MSGIGSTFSRLVDPLDLFKIGPRDDSTKSTSTITNTPTGKPNYMPPPANSTNAAAEEAALNKNTAARTLLTRGAMGAGAAGFPQVMG